MNLEKMSFNNYVWSHNPRKINIEEEKNIVEFMLPFNKNILQNLGRKKRIVKGEGELFGVTCFNEFKELRELYLADNSAYLKLPGIDPFLARFSSLKMVGEANEDVLTYTFEFIEEIEYDSEIRGDLADGYYIASDGDTLWTIANKYNISVSTLLELNKDIRKPEDVSSGQKVLLR